MQDHVGDEFDAVIASVTNFGLFVRLNDLFIDGLVHISSLASDYYQFDPMRQRLIGENTRKVYQVGDEVSVKVAAVNLDDRQIDLVMIGDNSKGKGKRRSNKPLTARERVNLEGAKLKREDDKAKGARSSRSSAKSKAISASSDKPKSKASGKPKSKASSKAKTKAKTKAKSKSASKRSKR